MLCSGFQKTLKNNFSIADACPMSGTFWSSLQHLCSILCQWQSLNTEYVYELQSPSISVFGHCDRIPFHNWPQKLICLNKRMQLAQGKEILRSSLYEILTRVRILHYILFCKLKSLLQARQCGAVQSTTGRPSLIYGKEIERRCIHGNPSKHTCPFQAFLRVGRFCTLSVSMSQVEGYRKSTCLENSRPWKEEDGKAYFHCSTIPPSLLVCELIHSLRLGARTLQNARVVTTTTTNTEVTIIKWNVANTAQRWMNRESSRAHLGLSPILPQNDQTRNSLIVHWFIIRRGKRHVLWLYFATTTAPAPCSSMSTHQIALLEIAIGPWARYRRWFG